MTTSLVSPLASPGVVGSLWDTYLWLVVLGAIIAFFSENARRAGSALARAAGAPRSWTCMLPSTHPDDRPSFLPSLLHLPARRLCSCCCC